MHLSPYEKQTSHGLNKEFTNLFSAAVRTCTPSPGNESRTVRQTVQLGYSTVLYCLSLTNLNTSYQINVHMLRDLPLHPPFTPATLTCKTPPLHSIYVRSV